NESFGQRTDMRQCRGRAGGDERRIVVLTGRKDVEADLIGLLCDGDRVFNALMFGRRRARRRVGGYIADGEDTELHARHVCSSQCALSRGLSTSTSLTFNLFLRSGVRSRSPWPQSLAPSLVTEKAPARWRVYSPGTHPGPVDAPCRVGA